MKKIIYLLLIHLLITGNICAKQCQNDSTGLIPISDLEIEFNGWSGGLYGNWQNNMPEKHLIDGINIANSILPLDANGFYNADGKIGFISIGMSNCNQFFEAFISKSKNYSDLNESLHLLNCAVGGKDIDRFLDKQDSVWIIIKNKMLQSNLSNQQVQVIWFLQAKHISGIPKGEGIEHISIMYKKFLDLFRYLKIIFPNLKQIYSSGRDYGGYSDENRGNPEPYAYYTNWSYRKLVEEQINGNLNFRFSEQNAPMPFLAWSNYIWADGKNKRNDGFNWICPEDLQEDGVHPSNKGKEKVASMLLNFFSKDETAKWFRKSSTSSI